MAAAAKDKSKKLDIGSVKDVRKYSLHTSTIGAFVQQPDPCIVGVKENEIIASCDAKSLYPTIMALLNIGFDTLYARLYDYQILEPIVNLITHYFENRNKEAWIRQSVFDTITGAFKTLMDGYCQREKPQGAKVLTIFNIEYYTVLLERVFDYPFELEHILKPTGTKEYILLRSCLLPIFEFVTWTSSKNKKYSKTITDRVFHNETTFNSSSGNITSNIYTKEYSDKKFYIFTNVNSTKLQFHTMNFTQAEEILDNYLLNPYGTIYYNQEQYKSFSVDIIISDMEGRAKVKNKMLILEAIENNWNLISETDKLAFVLDNSKIDIANARSILEIVGDSDDKKKQWQLDSLMEVDFFTENNSYRNAEDKFENLRYQIDIMIQQLNVRQNGIKTSLNSDYGIYAMVAWEYANFLISNSITTGGKVLGTNLFQQVAKNVLRIEEANMVNILEQNMDVLAG